MHTGDQVEPDLHTQRLVIRITKTVHQLLVQYRLIILQLLDNEIFIPPTN